MFILLCFLTDLLYILFNNTLVFMPVHFFDLNRALSIINYFFQRKLCHLLLAYSYLNTFATYMSPEVTTSSIVLLNCSES